jgi:polar amino acid transport system substrate-binding protein
MHPMRRRTLALAVACLIVPTWAQPAAPAKGRGKSAATPTAPRQEAAGHLLETIRKRGVLRVGFVAMVPWAMRDPAGEWQGYQIDVARQLASDLGVELELVRVRYSHFTDAVNDGTVDVMGAGHSITPQRALVVDFSNPYAQTAMQLVARVDLAETVFDRPDFTLGVRAGGTTEATARSRFPRARIVTYPRERTLHEALKEGQVDGALVFGPRATFIVADSGGRLAEMAGVPLPRSPEGFAVRKDEQGWLNFLNAWIAYWKADGWLDERRRHWFETLEWTARFRAGGPAK